MAAEKPGAAIRGGKPRVVSDASGRIPAFQPTKEQHDAVRMLASFEIPLGVIASTIGISYGTLHKHFDNDIRNGRAHIEAHIGSAVVREAIAGNMTAARMWLLSWGHPNWRKAKEAVAAHNPRDDEGSHIKFYIPSNRRDEPEPDEGPTIEGDPLPDAGTGTDG